MLLLPPLSSLFPYTTLFRSSHLAAVVFLARIQVRPEAIGALHLGRLLRGRRRRLSRRRRQDRKSTRLNSSHRCISYAVFCLKKKKQKYNYSEQQVAQL